MQSYEFELLFALPSAEPDFGDYEDRLFEAGCDDALLGIGRPGWIALDFGREAADAKTAVLSAISNVRMAIPDAVLVEASPDLVGVSDIAELVGRSRQNMRKLLIGWDASIPVPVHCGSVIVWHLCDVLLWLRDQKGYDIDAGLIEVSRAAMMVNAESMRMRVHREEASRVLTRTLSPANAVATEGLMGAEALAEYIAMPTSERFPGDLDRRAFMRLPLEERRAAIRAQAKSVAAQYNADLDTEWLDAALGDWGAGDE